MVVGSNPSGRVKKEAPFHVLGVFFLQFSIPEKGLLMNTIWSTYIQKTGTLYQSRNLRFADLFREKYMTSFGLPDTPDLRILEIGCGPGSLAQALHRWYPEASVTGLDRDTEFIAFANSQSQEIRFLEGDAEALPFPAESFHVTISNTVMEHIEPGIFLSEQYRVLCPGGICLVLSARPSRIHHAAPCIAECSAFEKEIYSRTESYFRAVNETYGVCRYPRTEQEMPQLMQTAGFHSISTEYLTINLTPDNPMFNRETAHAIINANRQNDLDGIDYMPYVAPGIVSAEELAEMKRLIHAKYDKRIELYDAGIPQWDTDLSLTMVLRGMK